MRSILTVTALAVALAAGAAAQDQTVHQIGNGVTSPVLIKEVKPAYTDSAIRRKVQGTVELSAVVRSDGTVGDDIKVTRSLDDELDQQAIAALKQWRFKAGTKEGHPVNVEVAVELTFSLRDKKS